MASNQVIDTTSSKSYAAACGAGSSNYEPSGPEDHTRNAHSVDRGSRDNGFSPDVNPEALEHAQKFYEQFSYALTKMGHRGDMFKLWNDAYVPTTDNAKSVDFNKVLYAMAFGLKVCRVKQNTHVLWKVNRPRFEQRRDDRGDSRQEQPRYRDDRGHRDDSRQEQPRYRDDRGHRDDSRQEQPRYRDDRGHRADSRQEQPRYRDDRGHRDDSRPEHPSYRDHRADSRQEHPRQRDDRGPQQPQQSRWDRN
jgi:hypothetical protein